MTWGLRNRVIENKFSIFPSTKFMCIVSDPMVAIASHKSDSAEHDRKTKTNKKSRQDTGQIKK